jgi:dTMP kinase
LALGSIVEKSVKMFSLGYVPDLTLVLDVPAKTGLKRIKNKDRIESRSLDFHNRLRKGYFALSKKYPKRIKMIDADSHLDEIYKKVEAILKAKFNI